MILRKAAIGQKVRQDGEDRHIVGVIADYHQMSLKQEPIPLLYRYLPANVEFLCHEDQSGPGRSGH